PPHAAGEVARIAEDATGALVLAGPRARVPDVLAGLDGAATAHVAAHGTFRADNPLFSHLSLADGPLTVHDLLPLRRPPGLLVLSACDSGVSTVHEGDELMGFAAAMLGLGTRTIIASVGPVDDEATRALMVDLHRRLARAVAPAQALAEAQAAQTADALSSTHAFRCFGAG
ncbi:CHAT domain-containing protein, partial [Luedemannella flava]|uniref:CHAT domain-containing protein n=1 Tax=Luedemannella flava TaxID=349316 RepID=UPI0031D0CD05